MNSSPYGDRAPSGSPPPNQSFLGAAAGLWASRGNGVLIAHGAGVERSIWVSRGCAVAATSNVPSESLGAILADQGRMDQALVEPIGQEAFRHGRSFGDQLVIDKLMTPTEVAEALEQQVIRRFAGAAVMAGHVLVEKQSTPMLEVTRQTLGSLTMDLFRSHLDVGQAELLVQTIRGGSTWMWIDPAVLEDAKLRPWETRLVRRAREPFAASDLFREAGTYEQATRFLASMIALKAITFEGERSKAATTARLATVRPRTIALDS